jgi:hypothetical protein
MFPRDDPPARLSGDVQKHVLDKMTGRGHEKEKYSARKRREHSEEKG